MKHVLPRVAGWLALFWLWMLLAGDWSRTELVSAAIAATIASLFVRRLPRVPGASSIWSLPGTVLVDFGILMWALVRSVLQREIVRGEFVQRPFRADDAGVRAWVGILATYSPNAYVVGFDTEREVALVHDLVRNRSSESPV